MKTLFIIVLSLSLLSGCAFMKTVCHPTADQAAQITTFKTEANTLLTYFQSLKAGGVTVEAAILGLKAAIAVYDEFLAGVCLAWDSVTAASKSVKAQRAVAIQRYGMAP